MRVARARESREEGETRLELGSLGKKERLGSS